MVEMTGFEPASISFTYPRGMRLLVQVQHCPSRLISIHIPERDVTYRDFIACLNVKPFQSTHPRGVRHGIEALKQMIYKFQSTHPRGVRPTADFIPIKAFDFNPRTREGCDPYRKHQHTIFRISIHAPARGATFIEVKTAKGRVHFNPRTREGCDCPLIVSGAGSP